METTKIHVTNMNLHYGDFHALKNINNDWTFRLRKKYIFKVNQPHE